MTMLNKMSQLGRLALLLSIACISFAQQPASAIPAPVVAFLSTFGGSFPCQDGLTQFCGDMDPTYMLMIHGVPQASYTYTVTATLQDGMISVLTGQTTADQYGWSVSGGLEFGGVVVSYQVEVQ